MVILSLTGSLGVNGPDALAKILAHGASHTKTRF